MKKIGIVANLKNEGALDLLGKIKVWLEERQTEVFDSQSLPVDEIIQQVELVISLGGDGTMLSVAGHMKEKSIPILGVHLGRVGFLTEVKVAEVFEELESFFSGDFVVKKRLMLACRVKSDLRKINKQFIALNDVVVSREGLTKLLHVDVTVSDEKLTRFAGDGLIIATPTGSTAYSLSAGGAVVHPHLEAFIITPICPHASSLRSLVFRADETIDVKIATKREGEKALLSIDGQENLEIDDSFDVEITKSDQSISIFKSSKRTYFGSLRESFKFPF